MNQFAEICGSGLWPLSISGMSCARGANVKKGAIVPALTELSHGECVYFFPQCCFYSLALYGGFLMQEDLLHEGIVTAIYRK
ncbi:hypothetical protein GDO81_012003 [Engystomops pustulosus]|uniref:Uncharacterized protein n=1 Tax=Engystomops pustulosus TaxID=76066 RepID=A0AAV7BID6_ENGPU|nr:hypothetical protein GDO81_012003 [Engystomops pustulosus]